MSKYIHRRIYEENNKLCCFHHFFVSCSAAEELSPVSSLGTSTQTDEGLSCEFELEYGKMSIATLSASEEEINLVNYCPSGSTPNNSIVTCQSSGEFDVTPECIPNYVEYGVDCGGTSVDFDESSMVLKLRVLGDDPGSTGVDESTLYVNPRTGSAQDNNNKVSLPIAGWYYNSSSDTNVVENELIQDSYLSEMNAVLDDMLLEGKDGLDIYVDWGDGNCAHVTHDGFSFGDVVHDYSSTLGELEIGTDGIKYATVKIKGTLSFFNNYMMYLNYQSDPDFLDPSQYFEYTLSEVIELGDVDWVDMGWLFGYMHLEDFNANFTDFSNVVYMEYVLYDMLTYWWGHVPRLRP